MSEFWSRVIDQRAQTANYEDLERMILSGVSARSPVTNEMTEQWERERMTVPPREHTFQVPPSFDWREVIVPPRIPEPRTTQPIRTPGFLPGPPSRILAQIRETLREMSDRRDIVLLLPLNEWDRDVRYAGRVLQTDDELFGCVLTVDRVDQRHVRVNFRRRR